MWEGEYVFMVFWEYTITDGDFCVHLFQTSSFGRVVHWIFFLGNIISINLSSQSNLSKSKKFQDLNLYDF